MKTYFRVTLDCGNEQTEAISRALRSAALADGVHIRGSRICCITWKKGEFVSQERIDKIKPTIKEIFELQGLAVIDVEDM